MPIRDKHRKFFEQHGFAIVEDFLEPQELAAAHEELRKVLPGWLEYCEGSTPDPPSSQQQRGGYRNLHFPYPDSALNYITLHPSLRKFASERAGGVEMYCEQSHLTAKHKDHPGDNEQGHHCDFGNHTLAYPPNLPEYWQTAYLLYYTDVTINHAPTAVCSWEHYPEKVRQPAFYTRDARPEIYENETKVTVPAGGLLIYSMRTFHRGTKFLGEGGRLGHFITYSPAAWKWLGIVGWPQQAPRREFSSWIASATPEERTLLGFPSPGHSYWTDETIEGVSKRYPHMNMTPYLEHLSEV